MQSKINMQIIKTLATGLFFLFPAIALAQTTYLQQGAKETILLERLEIKKQRDSVLNFSKTRPFSRKMTAAIGEAVYNNELASLSPTDAYNLKSLLMQNAEWTSKEYDFAKSKKSIWNSFYKTKANLYEVHSKDFFLSINPLIEVQQSVESNNSQRIFVNKRGAVLRGWIGKKIGFSAYLTENQERGPLYAQNFITRLSAVPGAGFYKDFKTTGVDYFDARGSISFNAAKYVDFQFGYDKQFIGNGYRSLFLSDFSNAALFLKINTRIWKINYQNLFMELQSAFVPGGDKLLPKKYAAMHHLDVAVTKWLNVGLFEGVIFGRQNRFDFSYLVPVIFYRSIEQQNGSFDNSVAGIDFKANVKKRVQLYGQLLLDEFLLSEIRSNRGFWGNKWAVQLGAKYIDAFGIRNLDLQAEANRARPFTYSHRDSVANYTHYNQPLAHPLGANFQELIGIARYQPLPRWTIIAKGIYYQQGQDTLGGSSQGGNIFLPNIAPFRTQDFGFKVGTGIATKCLNASLQVSYELRENLFIDLGAVYRKFSSGGTSTNTSMVTGGIRWNIFRREYDY
jgi:hypothetical protein